MDWAAYEKSPTDPRLVADHLTELAELLATIRPGNVLAAAVLVTVVAELELVAANLREAASLRGTCEPSAN